MSDYSRTYRHEYNHREAKTIRKVGSLEEQEHSMEVLLTTSCKTRHYPVARHNIPTPLGDAHRPHQFHDIIDLVNNAHMKLRKNESHLFILEGGKACTPTVIFMTLIITSFVGELLQKLKDIKGVLRHQVKGSQDLRAYSRDALVNLGVGFILAGSYLIMAASGTENDYQAMAARFHLEKVFIEKHENYCCECGHNNCKKWCSAYDQQQCRPIFRCKEGHEGHLNSSDEDSDEE